MEIREATQFDLAAIVDLLKLSLGESLMPKSEKYWRWKHIENPFGKSPVLLCWEGSTLIGVRAFMHWQWKHKEKVYRAVRAVDTATHPQYQGKGIFKKLTLSLIQSCKEQGIDFVFNTPNKQSKPGYLKMGWNEVGRLPIAINVQRPLRMAKNVFSPGVKQEIELENGALKKALDENEFSSLVNWHQKKIDKLVTNISPAYLKWRYLDVPVARYVMVTGEHENDLSLIIGRVKESRFGRELRITDCFFDPNGSSKAIRENLREKMKLWDIDYLTVSNLLPHPLKTIETLGVKASIGPIVTIRSINLLDLSNFAEFNKWAPSLGDLELF